MRTCNSCKNYHIRNVAGDLKECCLFNFQKEGPKAINPLSQYEGEAPCVFQRAVPSLCGLEGKWWEAA